MICLQCDNETFVAKPDAVIEQQFKGEVMRVQTPASACSECGWVTADIDQVYELRRRTADDYRKKHGLLTSDDFRSLRESLRMSQREFAAFIGVGEAIIKRWETWLVQEKSSDELIRLKCRESLTREEIAQLLETTERYEKALKLALEYVMNDEPGIWQEAVVTTIIEALNPAHQKGEK